MADQEFLASFGVEIDKTSQSGWQGTLTFTQYTPAVGVKINDNSSSATHVGSVGGSVYLSGEALLDELRRAGVLFSGTGYASRLTAEFVSFIGKKGSVTVKGHRAIGIRPVPATQIIDISRHTSIIDNTKTIQ